VSMWPISTSPDGMRPDTACPFVFWAWSGLR
jgi:hypothetical protein